MAIVSFSRRLADQAAADPSRPAVTCGERSVTRAELETAADALARQLLDDGVRLGDMVTIALPNSVDWFVAVVGHMEDRGHPPTRLVTAPGSRAGGHHRAGRSSGGPRCRRQTPSRIASACPVGYVAPAVAPDAEPLPDAISPAWKAPTSGGSTGRPKLIVSGEPGRTDDEAPSAAR